MVKNRRLLYRRVRQDGRQHEDDFARGDGAADHFGGQGGHCVLPERPHFPPGERESGAVALQPENVGDLEYPAAAFVALAL